MGFPGFVNSKGAGGEMQGLSNGLDFLWWSKENVNLGDMTSGDITIYFNHICTQIQLNLQSGPGTVIDAIYAFNMESPNPGSCTLQLGTGVITPSTTLSGSMQNLDSLNNVLFVNLVPFTTTNTDLLVKISISFKDKGSGWIDVNIPVPTDGYEQGHCYIYDVILDFPATTSFETARFDAMLRD